MMRAFIYSAVATSFMMFQMPQGEAVEQLKGANCIPVKSLSEDKLAYKAGESLEYVLHYKWGAINSDVARASVKLDSTMLNGVPVFHSSVFGKTAKFYDMFFKVREDFQSWFTRDGVIPMRFVRDSREGGYYSKNVYRYMWDPEGDEGYIQAEIETSRKAKYDTKLELTGCTYDLPALFYMARNMNFAKVKPNVKYPMTFVIDNDIYNVYFIWLGREKKYVKGIGTVKTMKFAAKLIAGEVFGSDSDMFVWISEDENRIPIFFEAPIKYGIVTGRLSSWEKLKHPFDAKISN